MMLLRRTLATVCLQCLGDFALYMQNTGAAADGRHAAITSWFWWAWNANSGDTGGIVSGHKACH